MKSFGAGEYKVFVELYEGEDEMHYFMTEASRKRFLDAHKKDERIKKMSKDPK